MPDLLQQVTRRVTACLLLLAAGLMLAAPVAASGVTLTEIARKVALGASLPALAIEAKAGGIVEVVEFYNAGLGHYFISADPEEIASLAGGAFGGAWKKTGTTFPAWEITGAPGNAVAACRFFGTDQYRADGTRIGPNSHFYTANPVECANVKTAWQSVAANGISYPAWSYESNAFAVVQATGECPAGTQPLYRAYNNAARGDPNHRYGLQVSPLQEMAGWFFEGLVMCLPQATTSVLPAQMGACGPSNCPAGALLGNGGGLVNIVVDIANTSSAPVDLLILPGQTFLATPSTAQDGLSLESLQGTIGPGTTRRFILRVFCMNASRVPSSLTTTYAPGPITSNANLLELANLTDGRIETASDPLGLKNLVVQYAVWEITDGRGALTPTQRSLVTTILQKLGTDPSLAGLAEQFLATLSLPP